MNPPTPEEDRRIRLMLMEAERDFPPQRIPRGNRARQIESLSAKVDDQQAELIRARVDREAAEARELKAERRVTMAALLLVIMALVSAWMAWRR